MDKVKVYVDSRFRTNDSDSNSDFKFELIEALDLADNIVCYVDDISIPHTWGTIESYNKLYIILRATVVNSDTTATYNWFPYVITLPEGHYDGYRLASGMHDLLKSIDKLHI